MNKNAGNKRKNEWSRKGRLVFVKNWIFSRGMHKEPGIDGILVTVGLCIIALLLCVVMKESLAGFIKTIVQEMTDKAKIILNGTTL